MAVDLLAELAKAVVAGDKEGTSKATNTAITAGLPLRDVIEGLTYGLREVGNLFGSGEYYLPELLLSGDAMLAALEQVKTQLKNQERTSTGKYLIGSVRGDMHDIGKNIVIMMLKGHGWEVIDLGVDVPPEQFCEEIKKGNYDILGMSALLTTTMPSAAATVEALVEAGLRDKIKLMLGGAPVTQEYCDKIGVDAWGEDAWDAVQKAETLLGRSG